MLALIIFFQVQDCAWWQDVTVYPAVFRFPITIDNSIIQAIICQLSDKINKLCYKQAFLNSLVN